MKYLFLTDLTTLVPYYQDVALLPSYSLLTFSLLPLSSRHLFPSLSSSLPFPLLPFLLFSPLPSLHLPSLLSFPFRSSPLRSHFLLVLSLVSLYPSGLSPPFSPCPSPLLTPLFLPLPFPLLFIPLFFSLFQSSSSLSPPSLLLTHCPPSSFSSCSPCPFLVSPLFLLLSLLHSSSRSYLLSLLTFHSQSFLTLISLYSSTQHLRHIMH